jgi:hypothetical protein
MMKITFLTAGLVVAFGVLGGAERASAGAIESACLKSNRPGVNRALCGCIQNAADQTLSRGEQRMAAAFFKDPEKAQEVRMSKKDRDNEFWRKYKSFGEVAAAYCTPGS